MKNKLGIHIIIGRDRIFSPEELICMMRSSLEWQEYNGPMIAVVDEPFYDLLYRNQLEDLYQDIIPIPEEAETEEQVRSYVKGMFADDVFFIGIDEIAIAEEEGKTRSEKINQKQKDFVDLQLELLPEVYQKIWHNTRLQELFMQGQLQQT
jgi:hypothetical protein